MSGLLKIKCHVVDCENDPSVAWWLPEYQTPIALCHHHNGLPSEEKANMRIDLARARSDYQAQMDQFTGDPANDG